MQIVFWENVIIWKFKYEAFKILVFFHLEQMAGIKNCYTYNT